MRSVFAILVAWAVLSAVDAMKIKRISHSHHNAEKVAEEQEYYRRIDMLEDEEPHVDKRQARTSCGRAPRPFNATLTSVDKGTYNAGDVVTFKCINSTRLGEGSSLSVTCLPSGQWGPLPVCQIYTYSCRRLASAHDYKGTVAKTRCGQPCQAWEATGPQVPSTIVKQSFNQSEIFPEYNRIKDASNYCRNPDPKEDLGPWCYINDAKASPSWGYCDVTYCDAWDVFDDYDRLPGACGCQGEWYNAIRNYGNIKSFESATLLSCKAECDNTAECQGMVFDENQKKCWLKKCTCKDSDVVCTSWKHETYYRKKQPPCPGVEFYNRNNQRICYYSLYNFNINSTLAFNQVTSRKLCQHLFPLISDIAAFETPEEWDFLSRNFGPLQIPKAWTKIWLGLYRNENSSDYWQWTIPPVPYAVTQPPNVVNYTRWAPTEPSYGYEEQCVQINLPGTGVDNSAVGRWSDVSCLDRAPVICEAKMPNFKTSKREYIEEREDSESNDFYANKRSCKTADCENN